MKCDCGKFQFAGPGELRNHKAYVDETGESCVICPACGRHYASIFSNECRCILNPNNEPDKSP